jgi:hypothetical protein
MAADKDGKLCPYLPITSCNAHHTGTKKGAETGVAFFQPLFAAFFSFLISSNIARWI